MLAPALLLSLIPLLPLGQAIDAEDPHPATAAPEAPPAPTSPGPPPAAPSPNTPVRETAVYYLAALGAPTGIAGLEGVHRLGSISEIAGGIGIGYAAAGVPHARPDQVLQWAIMPRLRLGNATKAFTAGAGVSGGNYGQIAVCFIDSCSQSDGVSYFLWSNLELGWEHWGESGFARRVFLGWAHGWCVSATCVSAPTSLPYFGIGLGYAF